MIDALTYNSLPIDEKVEILWRYGQYIETISEKKYDVSLYGIDGLYIEVFYPANSNNVTDIRVIEDQSRLDRYALTVDPDHLFI